MKTTIKVNGFIFVALTTLLFALEGRGDVRLPSIFSENMVLQQGMSVPVWGWADENEYVTVTFQGQSVSTKAKNGKWMVRLKNLKATSQPQVFTVDGKNRIRYTNVVVGEVWVCSGQSNMELPLSRAYDPTNDIANSYNPMIRLFTVPKTKSDKPLDDVKSGWVLCKPETVASFSAVAYYFGRDLQKALKVPVGLIHTSWGGSPAEVWMSQDVLESNPEYKKDILEPAKPAMERYQQALSEYRKRVEEARAKGQRVTNQPPRMPWMPSELYNGMIAPILPYAVKGAIWYQGESNAGRAYQYRSLFVDLIKNWREKWGQKEFYFFAVQLAPYIPGNRPKPDQPGESDWAELREAQMYAAKKLPGVGVAVITDYGEERDIHPKKKQPVGERLALLARGIAYKEKGLVYSGPIYKSHKIKGNEIEISFDHVGSGLVAKDGDKLKGFAICGEDKKWVWADARINETKDKVIVSSPEVKKPIAVRYGWADYPEGNLYNKEGLPASPFRTDNFPMITMPKK
jgi:sialate O-acetylesterase